MLDKLAEAAGVIIDRLPLNNKWYAWLICLPFALWIGFIVKVADIAQYIPDNKPITLMVCLLLAIMWWCCRKQKWLWILPYLCIAKILFALFVF